MAVRSRGMRAERRRAQQAREQADRDAKLQQMLADAKWSETERVRRLDAHTVQVKQEEEAAARAVANDNIDDDDDDDDDDKGRATFIECVRAVLSRCSPPRQQGEEGLVHVGRHGVARRPAAPQQALHPAHQRHQRKLHLIASSASQHSIALLAVAELLPSSERCMAGEQTDRNEGGAELEELERVRGWLVVVGAGLVGALDGGQVLKVEQVVVVLRLVQLQIDLDLRAVTLCSSRHEVLLNRHGMVMSEWHVARPDCRRSG